MYMEIKLEPKDVSKKHFYISLVKSAVRMWAGWSLITLQVPLAGVLFIAAEILGVWEEL
jgi:hypothetical protein